MRQKACKMGQRAEVAIQASLKDIIFPFCIHVFSEGEVPRKVPDVLEIMSQKGVLVCHYQSAAIQC